MITPIFNRGGYMVILRRGVETDMLAQYFSWVFSGPNLVITNTLTLAEITVATSDVADVNGVLIGTQPEVDAYLMEQQAIQLPFNGEDSARAYKFIEASLSRSGQTTIGLVNQTTSYETYLSLDVKPLVATNYKFKGGYSWSYNATNKDFIDRILLKEGVTTIRTIVPQVAEPKDSGGPGDVLDIISGGVIGGTVNSGTNQRFRTYFEINETLTAGLIYTIEIEWTSSTANNEAAIYDGFLSCEQATVTPDKL